MDLSKRASLPREFRRFTFDNLELRAGEGDALTLAGEASVVEHPYTVRDAFGEFTETISRGAFDKTLSETPDVVLLVNHEGLPLARTSSGTLKLSADPNLSVSASLDTTDPDVQRIQTKMKRGDLNEMSFAFRVTKQQWNEDYTDRQITEVNLHRGDVSVVNFGANPATSAALRSLEVESAELEDAIAALKRGDATDDQKATVARIATTLSDLLAEPEGREDDDILQQIREDEAALFERFKPLSLV